MKEEGVVLFLCSCVTVATCYLLTLVSQFCCVSLLNDALVVIKRLPAGTTFKAQLPREIG